jgi:hypothetical protein
MNTSKTHIEANVLYIRDLQVDDRCVVEYVGRFGADAQSSAVGNCLQLGARALSFAADQSGTTILADALKASTETTKTLLQTVGKDARESVTRSAAELPKKLEAVLKLVERDLAKTLDPASASSIVGRLQQTIVGGVTKELAGLADALDVANPKSPFSHLQNNFEKRQQVIEKQLADLLAQLQAKAAANAMHRRTTAKGVDFEDTIEAYLADESRPRHDAVLRTSRSTGIDGNDAGDIVIEVDKAAAHGPGLKIVVETKDSDMKLPALVRELDASMRNRGACFGIGVTTNDSITRGRSMVVPIGDDKLIVCAPRVNDDEFELLAVGIALEMARWKAIMARIEPGHQMDLNRIHARVESSLNVMHRFAEAKSKLTSIKTSVDGAWEYIQAIRDDLATELRDLRTAIDEELSGPEPRDEAA